MLFFLGKPRIIRLQRLQFFFRIPGGINCCNVTLHFYMILSFRNIICNNFVPNGNCFNDFRQEWGSINKLFGPVGLGTTPGLSQVSSSFCTVEAQFVPGTNPVCPWDKPGTKGGRKSLSVKGLSTLNIGFSPCCALTRQHQSW